MALFRSVALWPDCHHSQCSLAETQVDNQQRNTVAWFKCWFRHSLAMWDWASYFPPLFFGFLLCVAGIIDDAYLLELMEWLTMKTVLSCPVYIGCWSHQTQSSRVKPLNLILLFSNQLLSVFRLPQSFFKWMAACQMALFHPLHRLSLEDCWIGSDKLWLLCVATTWHALLKSAFACACVCVYLHKGPQTD